VDLIANILDTLSFTSTPDETDVDNFDLLVDLHYRVQEQPDEFVIVSRKTSRLRVLLKNYHSHKRSMYE
jgi:hypothetical protein